VSATGRSAVRLDQDVYPTPGYCVDKLLPWLDLNGRNGQPLTFFEPCRGDGAIYDRLPAGQGKATARSGTARITWPLPSGGRTSSSPTRRIPWPSRFKRSGHSGVSAGPELPRHGDAQTVLGCVSADTPVHHHPSPAVCERGLGRVRVRLVSLGPRGEGFDSSQFCGALSPFMKTDTPEPRYERFPGPFRADPLPLLHHPAPPICA
jgi:hypothetical protein